MIVATWAVGRRAKIQDLAQRRRFGPYDVTVVVLSPAVAVSSECYRFLCDLAENSLAYSQAVDPIEDPALAQVLGDKTVIQIAGDVGAMVFVVLHKKKSLPQRLRTSSPAVAGQATTACCSAR